MSGITVDLDKTPINLSLGDKFLQMSTGTYVPKHDLQFGIGHLSDQEVFHRYYSYDIPNPHVVYNYTQQLTPQQRKNYEQRMACDRHLNERMMDMANRFKPTLNSNIPDGVYVRDNQKLYFQMQAMQLQNMCSNQSQYSSNNPVIGNQGFGLLYQQKPKQLKPMAFQFDESVINEFCGVDNNETKITGQQSLKSDDYVFADPNDMSHIKKI